MGNSLGAKKSVKVMKINGETFKLKTPITAGEVVKDYPGHVLLESEAVKHYGTRAKPLETQQKLVPKRLYFLVELPKAQTENVPRRVRSGINMSAKDRLESLMLARRSTSDLSIINKPNITSSIDGSMRVKMRLPKAEVERLMKESANEADAAAKIMDLCRLATRNSNNNASVETTSSDDQRLGIKAREKRVSFMPVSEAEMQNIAVATY